MSGCQWQLVKNLFDGLAAPCTQNFGCPGAGLGIGLHGHLEADGAEQDAGIKEPSHPFLHLGLWEWFCHPDTPARPGALGCFGSVLH